MNQASSLFFSPAAPPMNKPNDDDLRRSRIDEFAADTPFAPAGWRWLAERWVWTERETEVAQLLVDGLAEKMIARELDISVDLVHARVKALYDKTRAHTRAEFANKLTKRCPAHFRNDPDDESTPLN